MIWLSPTHAAHENSIYFDIRDIDLQYHGDFISGMVRGLIGDGFCEIWSEVALGQAESAQFLPLWSDDGRIESLSGITDESLLQKQLIEEVKIFLQDKGIISYIGCDHQRDENISEQSYCGEKLAA